MFQNTAFQVLRDKHNPNQLNHDNDNTEVTIIMNITKKEKKCIYLNATVLCQTPIYQTLPPKQGDYLKKVFDAYKDACFIRKRSKM